MTAMSAQKTIVATARSGQTFPREPDRLGHSVKFVPPDHGCSSLKLQRFTGNETRDETEKEETHSTPVCLQEQNALPRAIRTHRVAWRCLRHGQAFAGRG